MSLIVTNIDLICVLYTRHKLRRLTSVHSSIQPIRSFYQLEVFEEITKQTESTCKKKTESSRFWIDVVKETNQTCLELQF